MPTQHWRTPIRKVCENCHKEYLITTGKIKERKYCGLPCSVEGKKKTRIILSILPRHKEMVMWKRYWWYRKQGIRVEQITDMDDANNFLHCERDLKEMTYKNKNAI